MEVTMKRMRLECSVLALCVSLVPNVLAQASASTAKTQMGMAWTQSQKPDPVPSPKPVPLPDQQPEQRPAPEQPPSASPDEGHKDTAAQTFTGTVLKQAKKYVLKTPEMSTYDLDDQDKARQYEGKKVQVIGKLDASSKLIHVQDIKASD
jgi:hypothetical protein